MGAATAIFYTENDPSISCLVLDSPFTDLKKVAYEIGENAMKMNKFFISTAIVLITKSVKEKINVDIFDLDTTKSI